MKQLLLFISLLCPFVASAQKQDKNVTTSLLKEEYNSRKVGYRPDRDYIVSTQIWDIKDGLSHRLITHIFQDSKGYIWLGTLKGLNRFDGYSFRSYFKEKDGLSFNDIGDVVEDSAENIWIKSRSTAELAILNTHTGKIKSYKSVEVPFRGFSKTLPDHSIIPDYWQNVYYKIEGNGYSKNQLSPVLPDSKFITATEKNTAWHLKSDTEIVETDFTGRLLRNNTFPIKIDTFYYYRTGWGIYAGNKKADRYFYIDTALQISEITDKLPKKDKSKDDVFFYTGVDDLVWYQGKLWSLSIGLIHDFSKDGIAPFSIHPGLAETRAGKVWLPTRFGIYGITITTNKFRKFLHKSSDSSYGVALRGLYPDGKKLYAALEDSGLYVCNDIKNCANFTKFFSCQYNAFTTIYKASNGNLFCGRRSRIYEVATNTLSIKEHAIPLGDGTNCWAITEIAKNKLLIGLERGLKWLNPVSSSVSEFNQYGRYRELENSFVLDFVRDRHGELYLCTNSGLYVYDNTKGIVSRYSSADSGAHFLPASEFQHLYQDKEDIYWLGTTSGLIRWDKAKGISRLYSRKDGLSNDNIYGVYEDKFNRLWMSSDNGIIQFSKATGTVRSFLKEDGIANNEFNRISHCKDAEGNIYFGSISGITSFNPDDFPAYLKESVSGAPLVITSFMQFDGDRNQLLDKTTDLLATNKITLNRNDRFFTVEFSLLNYTNQNQTLYYWKIDGFDTGWNIQRDRTIRLSRLPYGKMKLRIKAQEANGNWSKNELIIDLDVITPVYLRLWFIITAISVVLLIIIATYRWRLYLLTQENIRLDKVVKEKTNDLMHSLNQKEILLKEIHHRVKNNLQVISSLLRLQARTVNDDAARNALLESQNRVTSIALIHQKLYQNSNLDNVDFSKFANDLFSHIDNVYAKPDTKVKFVNNISNFLLKIDFAVPLALILNELLTNSYKHAFSNNPSPVIEIKFDKATDKFFLIYSDNGPGMPEGADPVSSRSMGAKLVYRLSMQINGKATFVNDNGLKCVIELNHTNDF